MLQRVNQEHDWMVKMQLPLDADTRREVIEHLLGVTIFFRVKHTLRTLAPEQVPSGLR